jgi:hypothetical protein
VRRRQQPSRGPQRTGEDLGKPLLIEVLEERWRELGSSLVLEAKLRLTNQTGRPIRVERYEIRSGAPWSDADADLLRTELADARIRLEPALPRSLLEPDEPVVGWIVHGFSQRASGVPAYTVELVDTRGETHRREVPAR